MKVLQLLPELNQGGVERGTIDMVEGLIANGHEAHVISAGGSLVKQIEALGGVHHTLPIHRKHIKSLFVIPSLIKHVNEIKPDIIHVRSRIPAWLNNFSMSKYIKKPLLITTFHGLYSVSGYSKIMTKAHRVIAISNTVKSHILEQYRIHPAKVSVITRGCDTKKLTPGVLDQTWLQAWYREFPQTKNKKVLSMVSRLSEKKGFDYFIRLIAQLDDNHHGLIVGSLTHCKPKFLASLKQLVHELKLTEKITFCDLRHDVKEIYALSDITYALKIEPEAFGRTVIESIQMKTPVIGWDIGGVAESLKQLFPYGLVPLKDEATLLEKTKEILSGQSIKMNSNPFTKDKMVSETLSVYKAMLRQQAMEKVDA
ncbi:MAG: glycosyltransferase [Pseudomonadota bacterium]|nr:glycosyltransferase [Pseudomonadota bacterium]